MIYREPHSLHIPVMGTGFTIDTALKVARYGISSAMSVDDNLMEKMREHYAPLFGETYVPIPKKEPDSRARRITAYLDFVGRAVARQVREIRSAPFTSGSEISKYFEMLEDRSPLKFEYRRMRCEPDPAHKKALEDRLRERVVPGTIDVNILTKLDRENYAGGEKLPREQSDALSAVRGFANTTLASSIVFSAGLNLHLFSYVATFDAFFRDAAGIAKKKIILKVSDYRSALTQAKLFAKKGIWVSEYRIESGLNCGGHAFATAGHLMGPVLEEFRQKRREMAVELFSHYAPALLAARGVRAEEPPHFRVTAQGGIGTGAENHFLMRYYELDGTGWGTPFLLVPEATCVDDLTLARLVTATEDDVVLTESSPMGVPIYLLRSSESERVRRERIAKGRPGSPCLNGYMAFNSEFSKVPICTASTVYQKRKIEQLRSQGLPKQDLARAISRVTQKACVCHDLGDTALAKHGMSYPGYKPIPAVCPGPNLVYFKRTASLKEMMDHIYGRTQSLLAGVRRSHMFINELKLYVKYLRDLEKKAAEQPTRKEVDYLAEFIQNLSDGIAYYRGLADKLAEETHEMREWFLAELAHIDREIRSDTTLLKLAAAV